MIRFALTVLLGFGLVAAVSADAEWEPLVRMDGHLFPSYVIATATIDQANFGERPEALIGELNGQLGVRVTAPADGTPFVLEVMECGLFATSKLKGTLATAGTTYTLYPSIAYDYDALRDVHQTVPLSLKFQLRLGDAAEADEKVKTCTVRSINDCPYLFMESNGDTVLRRNLFWMFAAYVNESHPQIDACLKRALESKVVNAFTGYQGADDDAIKDAVLQQVFSIWFVLQAEGIKYSSITKTSSSSQHVFSQHVRFIDESLENTQANCVDGTALFASILRKVCIEPRLVLVPGHMYLAFYVDKDHTKLAFLETTMIGNTDLSQFDAEDPEAYKAMVEASGKSFLAALEQGQKAFEEHEAEFKAEDEAGDQTYHLISIDGARSIGIRAIAYKGKD